MTFLVDSNNAVDAICGSSSTRLKDCWLFLLLLEEWIRDLHRTVDRADLEYEEGNKSESTTRQSDNF